MIPEHAKETVRRQAELFDTVNQAVIGTSLAGEILYWNPGAETIYGWRADDVLGRNVLEVTPSIVSQGRGEQIMRQLRTGRSWAGDFPVRTRDGEQFRVHVRNLPVQDRAGELVGIVGISVPASGPEAERYPLVDDSSAPH